MNHTNALSRFFKAIGLFLAFGLVLPASFAWDGRWTEASSGSYPLPDVEKPYKSTHGDSGLEKDRPQHYFKPPNPAFDDVDPDELSDNQGKDYSPYALVRLSQDIELYGKQKITKGYYLVKIGRWSDTSAKQKKQMVKEGMQETLPQQPPMPDPSEQSRLEKLKDKFERDKKEDQEPYTVLIFKQNGKELGVIPIERRELVTLPRRQSKKLPKTPMAWIEPDLKNPGAPIVFKFYYRHSMYIAQLNQV